MIKRKFIMSLFSSLRCSACLFLLVWVSLFQKATCNSLPGDTNKESHGELLLEDFRQKDATPAEGALAGEESSRGEALSLGAGPLIGFASHLTRCSFFAALPTLSFLCCCPGQEIITTFPLIVAFSSGIFIALFTSPVWNALPSSA